jgi:hypothetical protein
MTVEVEKASEAQKPNDKEYNFRKLEADRDRALQLAEQAKAEKEQLLQEMEELKRGSAVEEDESSDEPYVDPRTLEKKFAKFEKKTRQDTQSDIQAAVQRALSEERQKNWLKSNPDFHEVMGHAQKFADKDPELAESILEMPDNFERQKLVYKNIKALGLHKKEEPKTSIQETIDRNRRSAAYQPSGVGAPPYQPQGDFSAAGQKASYQKMQQLKSTLRI